MALKLKSVAAACALLLASTAAHAATTTFTLDNVTFDTDGTVKGSFTFDDVAFTLTNVSVAVSSITNPIFDANFTAGDFSGSANAFDFGNSMVTVFLQFTPPLSDSISNPLTSASAVQNSPPTGESFALSGSLDPTTPTTPLPAALPLFATGLGGLGLLAWRRKRKAQTVA